MNFQPTPNSQQGEDTLTTWKYDSEIVKKALAHMIIVDKLHFKFVAGQGFRYFCSQMQPKFHVPSQAMIVRDCYEMFVEERLKLKGFLKTHCKRIYLTTDTWTSIQRINYIYLTTYFIDND